MVKIIVFTMTFWGELSYGREVSALAYNGQKCKPQQWLDVSFYQCKAGVGPTSLNVATGWCGQAKQKGLKLTKLVLVFHLTTE